jgi:hypothetical protein
MNSKALKKAKPVTNPSPQDRLKLQKRIEERAHELWVESGCSDGSALSHWLQAEREVTGPASQRAE